MPPQRLGFEDIYPSGPHYSRGVRAGNTLYLSGCTANGSPAENGSSMEQLDAILDRLVRMVEAEGGRAADIVKLSTYVANPGDWFPFDGDQVEIFHKHFGEDYPVNTIVGVEFLTPNVLLEIDAIAVLD